MVNWDTKIIPNGDYVLRLEAYDLAGNLSRVDLPVTIQNTGPDISSLTVSPSPFTPDGLDDDIANDITDITFKLSEYGFTTVEVFNSSSVLVSTLHSGVLYPAPPNNMQLKLQWNGRGDDGILVRNGEYKVVVSTGGGSKQAHSFVIVNDRPIFNNYSVTPNTFSPDGDGVDDTTTLTFSLSESSLATVEVYNSSNSLIKTLAENVPITYGTIYNYMWDGKDNANQIAPQGRYYFKVTAAALTGSLANPLKMDIFLIYISDIKISQDSFNPHVGQTTQILYELKNDAKLSIKIYNDIGGLVRNLIDNQLRSPGEQSEAWDGKDNNGNILPDGNYYFVLEDSMSGTPEVIYDPQETGGQDISHSIVFSAANFNTLKNQPSLLTYNLPRPAKINIKVRINRYEGPAIRVIKYQEPTGSGERQTIWDGRDEIGEIVPYRQYTLATWGYTLRDNSIVIVGGRPSISETQAAPIKFNPIFNPYTTTQQNSTTISFSLSDDAKIVLDIYNSNNVLVRRLLDNVLKSKGTNTVVWDGKNNKGKILSYGFYRIELQAEKGGNYSDIVTAHTEVIY